MKKQAPRPTPPGSAAAKEKYSSPVIVSLGDVVQAVGGCVSGSVPTGTCNAGASVGGVAGESCKPGSAATVKCAPGSGVL